MQVCPVDLASPWMTGAKHAMSAIDSEALNTVRLSCGASTSKRPVCAALQLSLSLSSFTIKWLASFFALHLPGPALRPQLCPVHQESASAPSCHQQTYGERNYWEDRYFRELRAGTSQYEWYLGYEALRTILRWHIPLQSAVLQVGPASAQLEFACG